MVNSEPIYGRTRKLRATWTVEPAEDLEQEEGDDLVDDLVEALEEEIYEEQKERARKAFSRIPGKRG